MRVQPKLLPFVIVLLAGCSGAPAGAPSRAPAPPPAKAPAPATPTPSAAAAELSRSGPVATADVVELMKRADGPLLLDVRTPDEFAEGHVPGATNIPVDELAGRTKELEPYRVRGVVTYCKAGARAEAAAQTLAGAGFPHVMQMTGSMDRWLAEGRPVEKPASK